MADDDLLDPSSIYDSDFGKDTGLELDASSIYSPDWQPPPQPQAPERGDFTSGVMSGANSFMGLMNYAKAAVGALSDNEDWIREGIKTAEQYESKAAEYGQGRITDWDMVTDAGSMIDYFQFGVGTLAPYAAESIATGAIGAAVGSAVAPGPGTVTGTVGGMVAKQAAKEMVKQYAKKELKGMTKDAIEKKVKKNFKEYAAGTILPQNKQLVESAIKRTAMKMGATMGSMAGTYPIGLGDVASQIVGEDKQLTAGEAGVAAGLAVPYAALDVLPEFVGISRLLNPAGGGILRRTATGFLSQAPIEAATEVAQEEINIRTRAAYEEGFDPYGVEAWKQRRESAILGAAGGGIFGAATGLVGGDQEMRGLELDIKSNIQQMPKTDFGTVDEYNQEIINGIFGGATELSDHAAGRGPTIRRGREVVKPFINQMDIDAAPEIGSQAERRMPAEMQQLPGQQIDTLFADALASGMRNSTEINQFIIDQMYPQGRPLVDHGAQQRPSPDMERQATIDRVTANDVIPPTPAMMAEGFGMFPLEQRAGTELPPINPNDYDRATLQDSVKQVHREQREAEKGAAKTVLFDLAAGGGIDWDMALAEGLDPADMKAANKKGMPFGKPLFRRGSGNGFDWAAERWSQSGVPGFRFGETYEETIGGANDALGIITDMIQGKRMPIYLPGDEYAEADRQAEVARLENLALTLDTMLEEVDDYQLILETQGQAAADRFFYHSRMMDQYAEEMRSGLWEPGDPVTVNTEFDEAGERLSYLLDKAYEVDPETALVEFERLVDATDAEIAAAMYQIIGRSEDAETRAEAERALERAEAEPAAESAEQPGEEPGAAGAVPAEEAGERKPAETRVTPEEKAVLLTDRRKKKKKRAMGERRVGSDERRKEWSQRKEIEAMTEKEREAAIEELRRQILTDPMTGLGSREAWEQVEKKEYIAAIDADSLKYVNDKLGNKAGDELLTKIGKALGAEFGADAYHVSGDEFWVHGDNLDDLMISFDAVQQSLSTETVTGPGGSMTGLGFSWGVDTTEEVADREMKRDKEMRTAAGERVERGERPAGVVLKDERAPEKDYMRDIKQDWPLLEKPKFLEKKGKMHEDLFKWKDIRKSAEKADPQFFQMGDGRTIEQALHQLWMWKEAAEKADQQLMFAPRGGGKTTKGLLENWRLYNSGVRAFYVWADKNDKVWAERLSRQKALQKLKAGDRVQVPYADSDNVMSEGEILRKNKKNWSIKWDLNGDKLLLPPSVLRPIQPTADIDAAAHEAAASPTNDRSPPSKEQIEANNYKKGRPDPADTQGHEIVIETPEGVRRRPKWPPMAAHYGDLVGTIGADGDPIDVFLKAGLDKVPDNNPIYVIDQKVKGAFDEHKVMMGMTSMDDANRTYTASYTKGWDGIIETTQTTPEELRTWAEDLKADEAQRKKPFGTWKRESDRPVFPGAELEAAPALELEAQTEADLAAAEQEAAAAEQEAAIPPPETFELEGAITPAEESMAQTDLFAAPAAEPAQYAEFEGRDITWEEETEDGPVTVTVDSAELLRDYDNRIEALNQLVKDCG